MPKAKVEETIVLKEGQYEGEIVKNEVTTPEGKDYEYHDTFVKVLGTDYEEAPVIKLGCPFKITENTILGKVLQKFGAELKVKEMLDTDEFLKPGQKVVFSVVTKKQNNAEFANIVPETFRPLE